MSRRMKRIVLPFTAIVGQQKLKQALVLNAINPGLLGVLIRGEKGTGKSTAVRSLADLLPEIDVVRCPFNCSPSNPLLQCETCSERYMRGEELPALRRKIKVVELPLGATEDRVTGTLDIEKALKEGIKALEPGILAEANQGILYIDEVNLLDDHLVDVLLDSAAMGINTIEREGISVSHPSRFILVGTMNPEEGEIRPQLLDRFGLSVDIKGMKDAEERIEVIDVVEEFERDPETFSKRYEKEQEDLRQRILKARELLNDVKISKALRNAIVQICLEFGVHGHRADFLIARTAKTIAAHKQRKNAIAEDVKHAAELVLPHRLTRMPFEEQKPVTEKVEQLLQQGMTLATETENNEQDEDEEPTGFDDQSGEDSNAQEDKLKSARKLIDFGERKKKTEMKSRKDKKYRMGSGRRTRTLTTHAGKYVKAKIPEGKVTDIAIDATIRAAVGRKFKLSIDKEDLREKVRAKKIASVIIFVVDCSGSMGDLKMMDTTKRAVMSLLMDSYQKRDKVGFIAVWGYNAEVLLPPTTSVELAVKHLKDLPTGGLTPLSDGLLKGLQLLRTELWKCRAIVPIIVLVSDGKGNVPIRTDVGKELICIADEIKRMKINLVVIDTIPELHWLSQSGYPGYNKEIVEAGGGEYYRLDELDSQDVVDVVRALGHLETIGLR
jgi:magnesium chelatase subunit D